MFYDDDLKSKLLIFNPNVVETEIIEGKCSKDDQCEIDGQENHCKKFTPESSDIAFYKKAAHEPSVLKDSKPAYHFAHTSNLVSNEVFLTADLCPSLAPLGLNPKFIEVSAWLAKKLGHAVPVAFAISGRWIRQHPSDLVTLFELEKSGLLKITWVNHSYRHPYHPERPAEQDFLLSEGVDFKDEV